MVCDGDTAGWGGVEERSCKPFCLPGLGETESGRYDRVWDCIVPSWIWINDAIFLDRPCSFWINHEIFLRSTMYFSGSIMECFLYRLLKFSWIYHWFFSGFTMIFFLDRLIWDFSMFILDWSMLYWFIFNLSKICLLSIFKNLKKN